LNFWGLSAETLRPFFQNGATGDRRGKGGYGEAVPPSVFLGQGCFGKLIPDFRSEMFLAAKIFSLLKGTSYSIIFLTKQNLSQVIRAGTGESLSHSMQDGKPTLTRITDTNH
jgi:hypothetical protein